MVKGLFYMSTPRSNSLRDFFWDMASPQAKAEVCRRERIAEVAEKWARLIISFKNRGLIAVIADENLAPDTTHHLQRNGLGIIDIKQALECGQSDERIYEKACVLSVPIITHDNDFLNHRRFNPEQSPGVFILPGPPDGRHTLTAFPIIRDALEDCIPRIHSSVGNLSRSFYKYESNGDLIIYEPPFRPDPNLVHGPRSIPAARSRFVIDLAA